MTIARAILPALAAGLALTAAVGPGFQGQRELRDVLIVVDITRSMNVRDMNGASRLDATRDVLTRWIGSQPCGTRVGMGFFTERRSLTLIAPVEICTDYAALTGILSGLDWRMAWEGDSMVSKGLNHALNRAQGLNAALIFVTDGQEAPPLPYSGPDSWREESMGGVILGAGGEQPAPIPKYDDLGREAGFYGPDDVQHAPSRVGPPPEDAAGRPGYHPRQNPYGESDLEGAEHLSAMRTDYLTQLAQERGLGFARLSDGPVALQAALTTHAPARLVTTHRSLSPIFGALALAALLAALLSTPFHARKEPHR